MTISEPDPPNPDFAETAKRFLMEMPIAQHFGFLVTDIGPGLFEITQPFRKELHSAQASSKRGPLALWPTWRPRALE